MIPASLSRARCTGKLGFINYAYLTLRRSYHMSKANLDLSKAKVTKFTELDEPKWVQTNLIKFIDPQGKERDWECCSRKTRVEGSDCDGVGIIAILEKPSGPEIVLQKQFRPPVEGICIEFPAGLLDPNETLETCAERELLEETGYIGKAIKSSPVIFNDPGFCNTNLKLVHVKVDLSDPRNKSPEPQLEENEFIESFTVPLANFQKQLEEFAAQGYKIDARVQNVSDGIELAKKYQL